MADANPSWMQNLISGFSSPFGGNGNTTPDKINANTASGKNMQMMNTVAGDIYGDAQARDRQQQEAMLQYQQMMPALHDMRQNAIQRRQGLSALAGIY